MNRETKCGTSAQRNIIQSLKRNEALTHMNESWKYCAKWKKHQPQKATHIWFHFYEMSRTGKSMVDRRSNQLILKEINPQYSLEEVMLKPKLQYFGHLDVNGWLFRKDPDVGKDWGQKVKRATGDEMVGWHHWVNGHECEQTPGDCEGQGSLVCCSPWGHEESDLTWRLKNNNCGEK